MIAAAIFSEKAPYDKVDFSVFGVITLAVILTVIIAVSLFKVKRRHIHDFFGLLFISFTTRSFKDEQGVAKEILIYSDREIYFKADGGKCNSCNLINCKHGAIYLYYGFLTLASCLWFIVIAIEDTIYRKTDRY